MPKPLGSNDFRYAAPAAACSVASNSPYPARADPSRNLSEAIPPVKVL